MCYLGEANRTAHGEGRVRGAVRFVPMRVAWFIHALDTPPGRDVVQELAEAAAETDFPVAPRVTWASPGMWEEHTLNKARSWSTGNPDGLVLYTHTKGAYHDSFQNGLDFQALWRQEMADRLIRAWPARLADLRDYDTSGVWWWEPEDAPEAIPSPFYAGNFWWARASYLAGLPELPELTEGTRQEAELWVGRGGPRARWMSRDWVRCSYPVPTRQSCTLGNYPGREPETT